ncbi:DUF448 domain-containing protein [Rhizorhabdus dicambivorans]|uniref:DUF448 domain-containing protein n=1 Tax=Rhizorhabdus dicambivorans TaxID=1850238 RepID=A0A2A4FXM4_9SPHN|nr:DUF448 domain-containing protein [Rhizorhabdus dicambivorans]ATE66910.1 DUF448 domain-containing protein [Rhizorhabdus dicambivorans]PCE42220.1 DUF448 domain-containing protein [Rhizorhabdus dicambivorans]
MANNENHGAVAPAPGTAPDQGRPGRHVPERKCILTGEHDTRASLIRLALAPDGTILPDLRAKAPGRGAWIGVDRAALETALAKGKLKGALSRAFKTGDITIPADLPALIEDGLRRAALDRLGLEMRSGAVLTGSDKISEAARRGRLHLLLHAADASEDGNRKLDQSLRVGQDAEGSDLRGVVIPADRTILSMALGRDNVVHIGVTVPASAVRVADALGRWCGFIGRSESASALRNSSAGSIGAQIEK